jgi:cell division protein FtsL
MGPRRATGAWGPDFITIYFLQGARVDRKLALRLGWVVLGGILLVFCGVFLRVWQEMQIVQLGYRCGELNRQCERLQTDQYRLLSQRNALVSLSRVEAIARASLGMRTASREDVIFLNDPAAPAAGFAGWLRAARQAWPFPSGRAEKEAGLGGQDH